MADWWPYLKSDRAEIWEKCRWRLDTCSQVNALGQIVTKRDNSGAILNFDLCDLQKNVKSKTWVLCHVSLLDIPMTKIWR
jgi:hypothetical protein